MELYRVPHSRHLQASPRGALPNERTCLSSVSGQAGNSVKKWFDTQKQNKNKTLTLTVSLRKNFLCFPTHFGTPTQLFILQDCKPLTNQESWMPAEVEIGTVLTRLLCLLLLHCGSSLPGFHSLQKHDLGSTGSPAWTTFEWE